MATQKRPSYLRLLQGRVIYSQIPIPDPQGRNPKANRPFVVVTSNKDLATSAGPIQAVGITTALDESPKEHYVLLPHGPSARTGLKDPSAALCTWLVEVARDKVELGEGFIDAKLVQQIIEKIKELRSKDDGR